MKLNAFLRKRRHSAISRIYFISSRRSLVPQCCITAAVESGPAAYGEEWLCLATRACWENHIQRPEGLFCSHDFHHYRYIFPWDSSCLRSTSLEAEPEMRCVQVIYRVFSRRNHTGQRRGAKQEFGFILIQQGALEQQIAPVD